MSHFSSLSERANLYVLAAVGDMAALERARTAQPYAWKRVRRVLAVSSQQVPDRDLGDLHQVFEAVGPSQA